MMDSLLRGVPSSDVNATNAADLRYMLVTYVVLLMNSAFDCISPSFYHAASTSMFTKYRWKVDPRASLQPWNLSVACPREILSNYKSLTYK